MDTEKSLCSICFINDSKYTCPACGTKTCSIECVRRHKKQTECSGLVDQTKFVTRNDFTKDSSHLNRDYNFLLNVDRYIQLGKSDVKINAKNVFKHGPGNNNRGNKRFKPNQENEDKRIEAVNEIYTQKPSTAVKRENVLVIQLPSGMHRSVSNKTGYDKKTKNFIWTIEWVFLGDDNKELSRFLSYRLKEHLLLKDAVPMNILNNHGLFEKDSLSFFLDNVLNRSKPKLSLIELDRNKAISENLKDKIVLEYPTIYITCGEISKEIVITEKEAYQIEDSDSESSSDSDSDSSSDSSDSDSSDDDSSDSDGAPEESSSKAPNHEPIVQSEVVANQSQVPDHLVESSALVTLPLPENPINSDTNTSEPPASSPA
ncbi:uncharacterized protein CANTADRAFT_25871 [Suhomyces tanzawaensis NRRL Y-17324]|uniref:HIT-type domain-containing protein n=1 Tax=Suhomyces tanzawaensis NRRL Y-17324 TaxID=984487 RepID=A0A1E4SKY7_9ASCO|nr:uncharacterized protein CANTADRAFT_25871 [Suhomyces tanzawaensis NRRL Y-17324]ODV80185.1 hypothetical protein CANTADRAFT_25871 [Suhomyces tanzawaensis NRRL Y-17324]